MSMNKTTRLLLRIIGGLGVLIGLIWMGQGTGVFPYPKQSFMIDNMVWAYRGFCVAAIGGILLAVSRLK